MAKKRMFAMTIVDSDAFLDMPTSTQLLYFHLNMRADDDGFIGNPKRIQKLINSNDDDLKLLLAKRFILVFEDGVIVIKHWRIHNTIQADRYTPTVYQEELQSLLLKDNKAYSLTNGKKLVKNVSKMETKCFQNVSTDIDIDIDIDIDKDIDIDLKKEKDKKEKSYSQMIDEYTSNEELKLALLSFVDMRKAMKGFTKDALKLNLNKLDKLASNIPDKVQIVENSIEHTWKGFYALKTEKGKPIESKYNIDEIEYKDPEF